MFESCGAVRLLILFGFPSLCFLACAFPHLRFISSENFLVIGGKDMQQNENLVKKYLKAGDAYVHAEIHGASSVIVKNHTSSPIPALTLSQAGSMTICRSNAWKEKVLVQAYWVHADQVSKTPPTGLSLPTGSFMIRGRKNFLPSMPLVMGVGLLWKLDDSCRAKHAGERKVRAAGEEAAQTAEDKFDQISDLPGAAGAAGAAAGAKASSSSKKKKGTSSSSSGSNKKNPSKPASSVAAESSPDFDVTSHLGFRGPTAPTRGSAPPIGRLTSEDEGTDAEEEEKKKRIAQLAEGGAGGSASAKQPAGKKKLSVAERKKLKKGGQPADEPAADASAPAEPAAAVAASAPATAPSAAAELSSSDDDAEWGAKKKQKKKGRGAKGAAAGAAVGSTSGAAAPAAAAAPTKPLPRGKRTKLKRVADRYKNQDEDDLVLAASLLGLQNVEKKKMEVQAREKQFLQAGKKEGEAPAEEEESSESEGEGEDEEKKGDAASSTAAAPAAAADDDSTKVCFLCKSRGHVFKSCPSRASAPEDVSFASLRRAAETAEEGEVARLMAEEGIAGPEDDAAGSADTAAQAEMELSGLTGRPLPDDLLHFALPVCAPYDALAGYKFKLKLLPGAAKKGKAAKQALQLYMSTDKVTAAETDLLKLVPEQELINVLLSNIKLSYPGQQDGKKKTKNKPKAAPGGAASSSGGGGSAKAGAAAADDD